MERVNYRIFFRLWSSVLWPWWTSLFVSLEGVGILTGTCWHQRATGRCLFPSDGFAWKIWKWEAPNFDGWSTLIIIFPYFPYWTAHDLGYPILVTVTHMWQPSHFQLPWWILVRHYIRMIMFTRIRGPADWTKQKLNRPCRNMCRGVIVSWRFLRQVSGEYTVRHI